VAIVSQSTAQRLWQGADPIGRTLAIPLDDPAYENLRRFERVTVIGVSRDAATGWIGKGTGAPMVYYPQPVDTSAGKLVVRVASDALSGKAAIERALSAVDSSALLEIHSLDDAVSLQVYPFRAMYWVASALGFVALTLTLIGVYGVVSYVVAQRRRELGIRLALGAMKTSLTASVIAQSMRLTTVGLVIGAGLALGVSRLFASFIPGLDTYNPAGYLLGIALVLVACFVAAFGPSYRAGAIDPVEALRADS
jgi:hypothetical protein